MAFCDKCYAEFVPGLEGREQHQAELGHWPGRYKLRPRHMSAKRRLAVFERDQFTCLDCGFSDLDWKPIPPDRLGREREGGNFLTLDHIRPWSLGGNNAMSNLQTLCYDCNQDKAAREAPQVDAVIEYLVDQGLMVRAGNLTRWAD